ncbi:hypothetical protein N7527_001227 [Penicillium freii]|nr:hypothetical protein N7527_001227 [Penicillium freii]
MDILFPALHDMDFNNVEASVMSADATATTYQLDCRSSATKQCTSSGYLLPQTLTAGPSFQDFHYDVTSFWNSTIFIVTAHGYLVARQTPRQKRQNSLFYLSIR